MKLAFSLFRFFPYGGLQNDFLAIAKEAIKRGHSIEIYTMAWDSEPVLGFNINIISVKGMSNHQRALQFNNKFSEIIRDEAYDSVIGFNKVAGLHWYFAADDCLAFKLRTKNKFRQLLPRYRSYLHLERDVFDRNASTNIMVLTEDVKNHYIRNYQTQESRFYMLPPYVNKKRIEAIRDHNNRDRIRSELKLIKDSMVLLMIGSNYHVKGVDRSIRALAALPDNWRLKTYLLVAGQGKVRTLERLARRLCCLDQVKFLGPRDDVPRLLYASDILLHPSRSDTAGNVITEALVAGLPALVTDTTGYAFHVKQAGAGKLIPNNPFQQRILNKLLHDFTNESLRQRYSKAARTYAKHLDLSGRPRCAVNLIERGVQY